MRRPVSFLAFFAASFCVLCGLAIALGVLVDPYYIFDSPRVAGLNIAKPASYHRGPAAKTYLMERNQPRTLLIGNSRIEVGFDPRSAEWPAAMQPVFNAGIGGSELSISAKFLEDRLATPGLQHVLVGVDLLDFLQADGADTPGPVDAGSDQDRMRVHPDLSPNTGMRLARAEDKFAATLTLDAVIDSLSTILAQRDPAATTMTPQGWNPLAEYGAYVKQHGFRDLFDQKQAQYAERFPHYAHLDYADPYSTRSFRCLREILNTARSRDLDVTLIIYPYHAWVMDLLRKNGLWNNGEAWKRALVRVVAELDPAHRVRLVDFSGYNRYTTEAVPAAGDTQHDVHWYWEPGHFRPALGDQIIARLYGGRDDGFGRDLTPESVNEVIASIRQEASIVP